MTRILVVGFNNLKIGVFYSDAIPRVGEYLDANNGHWIVGKVQHDITGDLVNEPDRIDPVQRCVVLYVTRIEA